jgi:hypothetical protein
MELVSWLQGWGWNSVLKCSSGRDCRELAGGVRLRGGEWGWEDSGEESKLKKDDDGRDTRSGDGN